MLLKLYPEFDSHLTPKVLKPALGAVCGTSLILAARYGVCF